MSSDWMQLHKATPVLGAGEEYAWKFEVDESQIRSLENGGLLAIERVPDKPEHAMALSKDGQLIAILQRKQQLGYKPAINFAQQYTSS